MSKPRKTFEEWMKEVDAALRKSVGLSYLDLSDCPYRDWYDNRVSPATAAKRAKKAAFE